MGCVQRTLVSVVLCVLCLRSVCNQTSISVNKAGLMPGDKLVFRCTTPRRKPHQTVQIVKAKLPTTLSTMHGGGELSIPYGPYVISNNTQINYRIREVTNRYSISVVEEWLDEYSLTVRDVRPEDSGMWGCRVLTPDLPVEPVSLIEVLVYGPIEGIEIIAHNYAQGKDLVLSRYTPPDPAMTYIMDDVTTVQPMRSDAVVNPPLLELHENTPVDIRCIVNVTNTKPTVLISVDHHNYNHDITNRFMNTTSVVSSAYGGGSLVVQHATVTMLAPNGFLPSLHYHDQWLTCSVSAPNHPVQHARFLMNVTFPPRQARCKLHALLPRSTDDPDVDNVRIVCKVYANPPPNITWTAPDLHDVNPHTQPQKYATDLQTAKRGLVTASLTIYDLHLDERTKFYRFTAENPYSYTRVMINMDERVSAASPLHPTCTVLPPLMVLVMVYFMLKIR